MNRAAALILIAALAGCSTTTESDTTTDKQWTAKVDKWEHENAIDSSDWADLVKQATVKNDHLWVETKIHNDADAKPIATSICGGYSTIRADYPQIQGVTVRASDGTEIARCGN